MRFSKWVGKSRLPSQKVNFLTSKKCIDPKFDLNIISQIFQLPNQEKCEKNGLIQYCLRAHCALCSDLPHGDTDGGTNENRYLLVKSNDQLEHGTFQRRYDNVTRSAKYKYSPDISVFETKAAKDAGFDIAIEVPQKDETVLFKVIKGNDLIHVKV